VVSSGAGQPYRQAQNDAARPRLKTGVRADPLVQAVLARFPGVGVVDGAQGRGAAGAAERRSE